MHNPNIPVPYFNASGSVVLGVDIVEDFARDLQHRFDHSWPYSALTNVTKSALHFAVQPNETPRLAPARFAPGCRSGWWTKIEQATRNTDHYCRITRQRLGMSTSELPLPSTSFPEWWASHVRNRSARPPPAYVRAGRTDGSLWRRAPLHGRHVDFLKVDVDLSWRDVGLEAMLARRKLSAMSIEIDASWDSQRRSRSWLGPIARTLARFGMANVSLADQLLWWARRHGYASYLKVPCCARPDGRHALSPRRLDHKYSTRYLPLASPSRAFEPTGLDARAVLGVQDLLLVEAHDGAAAVRLARLEAAGAESCFSEWCCSKKHSKRKCAELREAPSWNVT